MGWVCIRESSEQMKHTWIVAVALIAAPLSATADWQYTKWGMTVNEVVRASNGLAVAGDDPKKTVRAPKDGPILLRALARGPYEASGLRFVVNFLFNEQDKKLGRVDLELQDADEAKSNRIEAQLEDVYGVPEKNFRNSVYWKVDWRHVPSGNLITFMQIGGERRGVYGSLIGDSKKIIKFFSRIGPLRSIVRGMYDNAQCGLTGEAIIAPTADG